MTNALDGMTAVEYLVWADLFGLPEEISSVATERLAALPWWAWDCWREMSTTPAARARLRDWTRAGSIVPTASEIDRRLVYLGDEAIRAIVEQVLLQLPPPVTLHVLDAVMMFGTGWSTHGWMDTTPAPPRLAHVWATQLIVLSGHSRNTDDVSSLAAHEIAHAWLVAAPAPVTRETSSREMPAARRHARAVLHECAAAAGEPAYFLDQRRERERQACALTRAWGFTGPHADAGHCSAAVSRLGLEL